MGERKQKANCVILYKGLFSRSCKFSENLDVVVPLDSEMENRQHVGPLNEQVMLAHVYWLI